MKKFLVIEGMVHPEHYISDLDIHVAHAKEVSIPFERASWSRDLAHAIQQKSVVKKRILTLQEPDLKAPPKARVTHKKPAPVRKEHTEPVSKPDRAEKMLEKSLQENAQLKEMNAQLAETTKLLLARQDVLIDKLSEFIERPVQVVSSGHGNPVVPSSKVHKDTYVDEDVPTFVPSTIRSGKAKASEGTDVTSKSKAASKGLNDAASALKSLRKGKKK